jgi:hypothetical protein
MSTIISEVVEQILAEQGVEHYDPERATRRLVERNRRLREMEDYIKRQSDKRAA